ncbi:MAG TPA: LPXTG cell wall anchor domain-containing protein [Marmoricola sp.]
MKKPTGIARAAMSVLVVALVAIGVPLLVAGPASAHTPNIVTDCHSITVKGDSYESQNYNTLGIKIDDGDWTTKQFWTSGTLTVSLPQDGQLHTYQAYVHTNNPNQAYSKDYSGTIRACGTTHVTAVLWTKTDPTCSADGALVKKTEPAGVKATPNPSSGTGPGHYVITFSALTGYTLDGPTSQVIDVLPKLTGDQCATIVQPVTPTVTNPACTGPGTKTPGSITLPTDGGGISYTKAGNVVTATADATHKFVTLPAGWTLVDSHHATYTVTFTEPGDYPECLVVLPTPVPPVASEPDCDTDGDLVVSPVAHVIVKVGTTVISAPTHFGPGSYSLSYTAAAGYTFADGTVKTFPVDVAAKTLDCPATPVSPTVTQSVCTGPGTHSDPVVTFGDVEGDHITYSYDPETHVVTATPDFGYVLVDLPDGWEPGEGSASFLVVLVEPGACLVETTVVSPSVTQSVCTGNGTKSDPVVTPGDVEGDHVSYLYDATSRVVTASPDQGYELANLPSGWAGQENGTATFQVVLTDPGSCAVVVSPPTTTGHTQVHVPGSLPNTGGPNLWLAAGGLVLLLGGGLLVAGDRRRRAAVTLERD